jgi:hypothetical protein
MWIGVRTLLKNIEEKIEFWKLSWWLATPPEKEAVAELDRAFDIGIGAGEGGGVEIGGTINPARLSSSGELNVI